MEAIHALIPHVNSKYAKTLKLLAFVTEAQSLMSEPEEVSPQSAIPISVRRKNALMAMRPHVEAKQQAVIDTLVKFAEIKDISELLGGN